MAIIRVLEIKNFRGIRELVWLPKAGVNCLIGPGDSGKSTILDAIDLTMGARRQFIFSDSDFHLHDTSIPIDIKVTLGQLSNELLSIERYGKFHRGFDGASGALTDEPVVNSEVVLTLSLRVQDDLEPQWTLFSERATAAGEERNLAWTHRQDISPVRLGSYSAHHMAWGANSVLNKLSADKAHAASALAAAARQARDAFAEIGCEGVDDVLNKVNEVAQNLGVPAREAQALLDVRGVSFSGGAIALHDKRNVPLKNLGTGSSRLLVTGLQKNIGTSSVTILDEVEHGLEPYRIMRLLDELGAKNDQTHNQVFMTTHSPVVLRELSACQLAVVRSWLQAFDVPGEGGMQREDRVCNNILSLSGQDMDQQKLLRTNAEAFLAPNVIVCEGKTEVGLMRGLDFHYASQGRRCLIAHGCYWADGGGDPSLFTRALVFAGLGYRVAILMDSDKPTSAQSLADLNTNGVNLFRWYEGASTESALFSSAPAHCIGNLLQLACEWKSAEAVDSQIRNISNNVYSLQQCQGQFVDAMRPVLGQAASSGSWFKDIEPAERVMKEVIAPNWAQFGQGITQPLSGLLQWIQQASTAQPEPQG